METLNIYLNQICLWTFAGLLLCAAWSDIREYLIPNRITVALFVLYPAFVLSSAQVIDWPLAGLITGAVFLVCFIFFAMGHMGGGDVKLMTACALWASPAQALDFIFLTAFAGGALSFAVLLRLNYGWIIGFAPSDETAKKVPYGVAIAAGGLFVASRLMMSAGH